MPLSLIRRTERESERKAGRRDTRTVLQSGVSSCRVTPCAQARVPHEFPRHLHGVRGDANVEERQGLEEETG